MKHQPTRRQSVLALTCLVFAGACRNAATAQTHPKVPATPDPAAVEFLLASAAKEFNSPYSKRPEAVRKAHIGYLQDPEKPVYLLCGDFRPAGEDQGKWIAFATIKTSDYEQWIGGAAEAQCAQKKIRWYAADLAEVLVQRIRNP
jgi:hypothetical protein